MLDPLYQPFMFPDGKGWVVGSGGEVVTSGAGQDWKRADRLGTGRLGGEPDIVVTGRERLSVGHDATRQADRPQVDGA